MTAPESAGKSAKAAIVRNTVPGHGVVKEQRGGGVPPVCDDPYVSSGTRAASETSFGESRWPPAAALVVYIAFTVAVRLWLPGQSAVRLPWLVPSLEVALLVALVAGNPGRLARRTPWVRRVAVAIVVVLVAAALWATAVLVYDLIEGHGLSESPTRLLAAGALVWVGNNLSFGMLYWLMDSGGPLARSVNPVPVDFAFTQQLSPELAPPGWRPVSPTISISVSRTRPRSARPT